MNKFFFLLLVYVIVCTCTICVIVYVSIFVVMYICWHSYVRCVVYLIWLPYISDYHSIPLSFSLLLTNMYIYLIDLPLYLLYRNILQHSSLAASASKQLSIDFFFVWSSFLKSLSACVSWICWKSKFIWPLFFHPCLIFEITSKQCNQLFINSL